MAAGSGGFPHPAPSRSIRCAAPPRGRAPPRAPVLKRRTGWKTSRSKGRRRRPETARPAAAYRCPAGGRGPGAGGSGAGTGSRGLLRGGVRRIFPTPPLPEPWAPPLDPAVAVPRRLAQGVASRGVAVGCGGSSPFLREPGSAAGPRSGRASAAGPGGRTPGPFCGALRRDRSGALVGVVVAPRCRAVFRRPPSVVPRTGPRPGSRGCAPGYGKGRGGDNSMSYESEQP